MISIFLLLVFIATCYGLSNMVIYSNGPWHIFKKWRDFTEKIHPMLGEVFNCMMCFPFWVGLVLSAVDLLVFGGVMFTPFNIAMAAEPSGIIKTVFILLMDGTVSSGTTWVIHNIEEYFEVGK